MRIAFTALAVLMMGYFLSMPAAMAQEEGVVGPVLDTEASCTTPAPNDPVAATDERWKYCDIQMRQFGHRENMIEMRAMLDKRAENFKASTYDVHQSYKEALQKHHDSLGEEEETASNEAPPAAE